MNASDIRLEKTCDACPEQYDAFVGEEKVGYLRLRHGRFTVTCPDESGCLVFMAKTKGDGLFEFEERDMYLAMAKEAIRKYLETHG